MTAKSTGSKPPTGLSPAARKLWSDITGEFVLSAAEVAILTTACRQQSDVDALEKLLSVQGPTVTGSTGQERLNPAYAELRQARLALGKLVGQLALPDDSGVAHTYASKRASKAARRRWDQSERVLTERTAG